jgi:hypothetical protein
VTQHAGAGHLVKDLKLVSSIPVQVGLKQWKICGVHLRRGGHFCAGRTACQTKFYSAHEDDEPASRIKRSVVGYGGQLREWSSPGIGNQRQSYHRQMKDLAVRNPTKKQS